MWIFFGKKKNYILSNLQSVTLDCTSFNFHVFCKHFVHLMFPLVGHVDPQEGRLCESHSHFTIHTCLHPTYKLFHCNCVEHIFSFGNNDLAIMLIYFLLFLDL